MLIEMYVHVQDICSGFRAEAKIIIEPPHEIMVLIARRTAKAQVRLRIRAVSPEPSLFAHIKYGSRRRI